MSDQKDTYERRALQRLVTTEIKSLKRKGKTSQEVVAILCHHFPIGWKEIDRIYQSV